MDETLHLALMTVSTALTIWGATAFGFSGRMTGFVAVAMFFVAWIAASKLWLNTPKRGLTIEGLAHIVRRGAWPTGASEVR